MKRLLFCAPVLVLALLLFTAFCSSAGAFVSTGDGGWVWQNQLPQGNGGNGVCFGDAKHGWATGYWGTILATTNGGATWTSQHSGTTSTLVGITFIDAKRGWAVGYDGALVKTSNGGATWTAKHFGGAQKGNYRLFSVSFVDGRHGWISGGYYNASRRWWYGLVLKTSDGGLTWKASTNNKYDAGLLGVSFVDASHGWAVGYAGLIVTTSDGGVHWKQQTASSNADLSGVSFVDAKHGWAVARDGTICKTGDGGVHWKANRPTKTTLYAVSFADGRRGWACGASGLILATTDGGRIGRPKSPTCPTTCTRSTSLTACTVARSAWPAALRPPPTAGRRGRPVEPTSPMRTSTASVSWTVSAAGLWVATSGPRKSSSQPVMVA